MGIMLKLGLGVMVLFWAQAWTALAMAGGFADSPGNAAGANETWLSEVEREIADAEYRVTWQERTALGDVAASWHAPNRAQGFRTYFTDEGIRVIPHREESPAWEWSLALASWGRPGSMMEPEPPSVRPCGTRVEYDRGAIIEWYVNDRRGLEQGFTLAAPPVVAKNGVDSRASSQVHIDLALGGTLEPVIAENGQAIDFVMPQGANVLHYAALVVRDALGRELPAWIEGLSGPGRSRGIRIVFEDEDAVYPVIVDPVATSPAWMAEGDQNSASFGASVATAGDVNGDGYADVIVGAKRYDNGQLDEGRAFVFHGSAAGLATSPAWMAEGDRATAFFGQSVATAGDVNDDGYADVVVGAMFHGNDQAYEGRVYVYHGSAVGLATSPMWSVEGDQVDANLGVSVATAGDVNGDGYADVVVGAYRFDNGEHDEGRAYVYHGSAAGLATSPAWMAEGDQVTAYFGTSVASAGDVNGDGYADVIVGAQSYDNDQQDEGRAYVYHGSAAGLATSPAWAADSDQAGARFGVSVATAGDVNNDGYADVVVGADSYSNGEAFEGRAFVYHGSATGLATSPAWMAEGDQDFAHFGESVATAGDVNGDGYADVIVGAAGYENGQLNEGRASVYHGSAAGLTTSPIWEAEGDQASASFGGSVATAGDVNGDGYTDVIIGAPNQAGVGHAYVYHGSAPSAAGDVGDSLTVAKAAGDLLKLSWGASCRLGDTDYAIYEGALGDFTSHTPLYCSTGGETTKVLAPVAGDATYLIVPRNANREGSYGTNGDDLQRPAGQDACVEQQIGACE